MGTCNERDITGTSNQRDITGKGNERDMTGKGNERDITGKGNERPNVLLPKRLKPASQHSLGNKMVRCKISQVKK